MRTIKFRAWDKMDKTLLEVGLINFKFGIVETILKESRNGVDTNLRDIEEMELMQFTGLQDKNGTEIYEGDVFQVKLLDDEMEYYTEKGVVIFEDGSFWIAKPSLNSNNEITYEFLSDVSDMHFSEIEDEFIRLGTIYENPELLEATE